jgi:hypothetical protein
MTRKNIHAHLANALANAEEYAPEVVPVLSKLDADSPDGLRLVATLLLIEADGLDSATAGNLPELTPSGLQNCLVKWMCSNLHLKHNDLQERIERQAAKIQREAKN